MNAVRSLRGRPLQYLALVLGLWSAARVMILSREVPVAFTESTRADRDDGQTVAPGARPLGLPGPAADGGGATPVHAANGRIRRWPGSAKLATARLVVPIPRAPSAEVAVPAPGRSYDPAPEIASRAIPSRRAVPSPLPDAPRTAANGRLRGSFWLLWRDRGRGSALANAGQLGGSQAGFRVDKPLMRAAGRPVDAYGRISAAIDKPHAPEAAVGLAWRAVEGKIPVTLGVERRIALGTGARDAFALVAVSGFGPTPVGGGLQVEAYGQAGFVGLRSRDGFGDGRVTLSHTLAQSGLSLGISASGGFQPGVRRIDIGPRADLRLPLGDARPRLSVEWRERVAGNARPGSGIAITLGSDF